VTSLADKGVVVDLIDALVLMEGKGNPFLEDDETASWQIGAKGKTSDNAKTNVSISELPKTIYY